MLIQMANISCLSMTVVSSFLNCDSFIIAIFHCKFAYRTIDSSICLFHDCHFFPS
ncbi:hypothetical protein HanRHA438_Chr09g0415261 [Helianthus annuus]|nr:hypothetical protein HanRHA438_Chr09g0415261 [Helianthus annuus]